MWAPFCREYLIRMESGKEKHKASTSLRKTQEMEE